MAVPAVLGTWMKRTFFMRGGSPLDSTGPRELETPDADGIIASRKYSFARGSAMGRWGYGSVAICCAIAFAAGVLLMRERCKRRSREGATATAPVSPSVAGAAEGM